MKKFLLFISNGSEMLEISPFIDIFGWNKIVGDKKEKIDIVTISYENFVNATWNLILKAELKFNEDIMYENEYDGIIIPGGFGNAGYFRDIKEERFQKLLKKFYEKDKLIIGICTGAIALGEAGILKGKKATTYFLDNKRYFNQLEKFGAIPVMETIVQDKNIYTTANPESALIMGFKLLEKVTSKENMEKVAFNMGYLYLVKK
ncbi:DJ-1/PfpI family protein [Fusobacterium sp.]|uniref:DJ-1/PfpI family protein n=1 Tax=Fusobacterium sp. TaxID=68766 RepID=UPI0026155223|nr:DJ-1/PfpI family protein [Fusobacterium sp.]